MAATTSSELALRSTLFFSVLAATAVAILASAAATAAGEEASDVNATTVEYTVAHTDLGDVRGAVRSYGNMTVREFLGIRYAQPPTGNLRFSKPVPVPPWSPQTYDALSLGSWCPHMGSARLPGLISEDCLYLNVYAPYDGPTPSATAVPRAVMVYVHGGGFQIGSSSESTGAGLASLGDVVVVTLNYRLTVFGFLSTGGPDSPGNYGLWDQRAAFVWVHDNIAAFGGDPTRVTIFGQSAGAASMNYHAITPQNDQNLFQRVIAESGSVHAPWAFQYEPLEAAVGIAERLDCPTAPSATLVECLRTKNVSELMAQASGLLWVPTADGEFVLDTPDVMTRKVLNGSRDAYLENFSKYDYLVGFNSQETLMFVNAAMMTPSINEVSLNLTGKNVSNGVTEEVYDYAIKLIGQYNYIDDSSVTLFVNYAKLLYDTIYRQQLNSQPPDTTDMLRLIVQITGDFELVAPTVHTVNLRSSLNGTGKSYEYLYDVRRSCDVPRAFFWEGPDWLRIGADHADELGSVFAYPFLQGLLPKGSFVPILIYTDAERQLSAAVMQYWTNFAKNGDPNFGRPLLKPWGAWSTHDAIKKSFLHIKINESTLEYDAKSQEDFFWNNLVAFSRNRFKASNASEVCGNGDDIPCSSTCFVVQRQPAAEESDENYFTIYITTFSIVLAFLIFCIGIILVQWRKLRRMANSESEPTPLKMDF